MATPVTVTHPGTRKRVLLVDDDASMRILLPRILARRGFDVSVAKDADDAEKTLASRDFDAVVLDVQMPGLDGISLAKVVRTRWPDIEIIIVSAFDSESTRKRAADAGVKAFLPKPIGVEDLIGCLQNHDA